MTQPGPYKPSPRSRLTALLFTDRIGWTIASSLGFFSIVRWWFTRRRRTPTA